VRFGGNPASMALKTKLVSPARAASNIRCANAIVSGGNELASAGFVEAACLIAQSAF